MNELDTKYMKEAIKQAKKALKLKEVPIGCVIVYQDKIIARGYNRRNMYGFDGLRKVAGLMTEAWQEEKDPEDLIIRKGWGCESCI